MHSKSRNYYRLELKAEESQRLCYIPDSFYKTEQITYALHFFCL